MMKKNILILFTTFLLASCAPSIYKVYSRYDADPNFQRTKIAGEVLQLAALFIPDKQKGTRNLLKSVSSVDIINYTAHHNKEFQNDILNSFKRGGYREILTSSSVEKGATFFVKNRLGRIREFHVLNYESGNVSVFSIDGRFAITDLEKVYRIIKKQDKVKDFINTIKFKEKYSEEE